MADPLSLLPKQWETDQCAGDPSVAALAAIRYWWDIFQFPQLNLVKLHFLINWRERQQILNLELPAALAPAKVSAMVPGAVEQRPTSGDEQLYLQLRLFGNLLRIVLIHSAPYSRHDPNKVQEDSLEAWQDQGRKERIFLLTAQSGSCIEQSFDRLSNEVQSPAEYAIDPRHKDTARWENSSLMIFPVFVEDVKKNSPHFQNNTALY